MINGLCPLSKKTPCSQYTISKSMEYILTKIFYVVFRVLKVLLVKICKVRSLDLLFLVVFISFYISRYFSRVFRTSFNIIWKKDFRHIFSFFNGFTQPPSPPPTHIPPPPSLNSQDPLTVTKTFCQCSLNYYGFSRLLCYNGARKN